MVSLSTLVPGLRLAMHPLLPGFWVSEGLASLHAGQWLRGLLFGLLLASTAGVFGLLVEWLGARLFVEAWERSAPSNAVDGPPRLLGWLAVLLRPAPADVRAATCAFHPESPGVAALSERVRRAFDPDGVFETGRF